MAESNKLFDIVEAAPFSETWLNFGFYSYYFQRDKGLNDRNQGPGIEYRYSTVASTMAGRFYNTNREYSNYAGVYYRPIVMGTMRIGAVVSDFNGCPKMRDGGWFLAAIPVAIVEVQGIGVNMVIAPHTRTDCTARCHSR